MVSRFCFPSGLVLFLDFPVARVGYPTFTSSAPDHTISALRFSPRSLRLLEPGVHGHLDYPIGFPVLWLFPTVLASDVVFSRLSVSITPEQLDPWSNPGSCMTCTLWPACELFCSRQTRNGHWPWQACK